MHNPTIAICLLLVLFRRTTGAFLAQDQSLLIKRCLVDDLTYRGKRRFSLFENNIPDTFRNNQTNTKENASVFSNDSYLLQLPIFPLRKRVRFPTDQIVLNLYEPRYIALANKVLEQDTRCFGAIYSSHKPQMVSNGGMNPITPIVEKGDVGLIYEVHSSRKEISSLETKDRVQLSARGVKRFYVEKVLQCGYDNKSIGNKDSESLPYIVVEASLLHDVTINDHNKQKEMASLLEKYRLEIFDLIKEIDMIDSELFNDSTKFIEKTPYTPDFSKSCEMITFALSSKLVEIRSSQEMLKLLRMNCTMERLRYVMKYLRIR